MLCSALPCPALPCSALPPFLTVPPKYHSQQPAGGRYQHAVLWGVEVCSQRIFLVGNRALQASCFASCDSLPAADGPEKLGASGQWGQPGLNCQAKEAKPPRTKRYRPCMGLQFGEPSHEQGQPEQGSARAGVSQSRAEQVQSSRAAEQQSSRAGAEHACLPALLLRTGTGFQGLAPRIGRHRFGCKALQLQPATCNLQAATRPTTDKERRNGFLLSRSCVEHEGGILYLSHWLCDKFVT